MKQSNENRADLTKVIEQQTIEGLRRMIRLSEYPLQIGPDGLTIHYTYAGAAKKLEFKSQVEAAKWLTENHFVGGYEMFENGISFIDYKMDYYETERGWQEKETFTTYTWQDLQHRVAFDKNFMTCADLYDAVLLHEMQAYQDLSKNHAMQIFDALFGSLKNYRA